MSGGRIDAALRSASDTCEVVIGAGALASVTVVYRRGFGDRPAVVVADDTTYEIAGREVAERLSAGGIAVRAPHLFPGRPTLYADHANVDSLATSLGEHDAVPVAVGAGTVNDIVKRAAHERGRPYLCIATAASMDGYTAFGAAITQDGYKRTLACPAPRSLVADLDILAGAPPEMTSSGYADLLAKVPAGADWIAADELEIEPIDQGVWSLVQGPLREAIGRPTALRAGAPDALEALIEGLVMSGLAMQAHASSRPASGAEHQFSHLWEMEGLGQHTDDGRPPPTHGFKVGVGSIAITALYERLLARDLDQLDVEAAVAAWPSWDDVEDAVRAAHGAPWLAEAAVEETRAKYVDATALGQRLILLRERWPVLRERLREQLIPAGELRTLLRDAGCPASAEEIGLDRAALSDAYSRAQTIRRRFTVLDLANQAGILTTCVQELFAGGGFWAASGA
jgi:glycerol-1-phosphate dehydrogenase [NAD(P)+]